MHPAGSGGTTVAGSGGNPDAGSTAEGGTSGSAGTAADAGPALDQDAGNPPRPAGCGAPVAIGMKTETLDVAGDPRSYLVVVPVALDGIMPAPVLLGFHGGNGTAENAAQAYDLIGSEPALYVYPQAISWPEAGGVAWNVDPAGHDLPYFDALLADLGEKYCIDRDRVFAAGQSNGGFFVNALTCFRPDALRAIASAAGGGPPSQCTKNMAAMLIHGTADTTVTIDKGEYSRDYWLEASGCTGAPSTPVEPAPCITYTGCAEPVLWCEHDGGHPWPAFAGAAIRSFFFAL
jgi:polyhydroxybutyrate depolymerase